MIHMKTFAVRRHGDVVPLHEEETEKEEHLLRFHSSAKLTQAPNKGPSK